MIRFISRPNYPTNAEHSEPVMNHFSIHPMETTLQHIIRRTGKKPISCKCKQCQQQCRTCPCLGTPADIERLIDAGYSEQLAETDWCVGKLVGAIPYPIPMVQAIQTDTGCIFFHDGLCELHDKGLKPTEGRLSHHSTQLEKFRFRNSIAWNVAKEWINERNADTIRRIMDKLKTPAL